MSFWFWFFVGLWGFPLATKYLQAFTSRTA